MRVGRQKTLPEKPPIAPEVIYLTTRVGPEVIDQQVKGPAANPQVRGWRGK